MDQAEYGDKTAKALRTNIPAVPTRFIGRKREIRELRQLLTSSRLVTLTGAAGCGKTRLVLQIAAGISIDYPDGAHWVGLAHLADPALIPQTVAKSLHVPESPKRSSLDRLLEALRNRQLLLVLDNCEHLLSACAQLVETLLAETGVSVLVTSREPLSVAGEMLYPVGPMSLPPPSLPADDVDQIGRFDAIQLFVERARAILPDFELTTDNAGVVIHICRHLDGIPLAIELASARINVLTVEQIATRLDDHFDLLRPAAQVTYSHHDTLRAAIDWSHDLLSEPEKILFRRLSVFARTCSLATAKTVSAGDGIEPGKVLDLLSSLVNKSLIKARTLQRGDARYTLLETIRQYAAEKLIDSSEWNEIHDRHLVCFLRLAEETELKLTGQYQQIWLNWLEDEYDNIRAALTWSQESGPTSLSLEDGSTSLSFEGDSPSLSLEISRIEAGLRIAIAIYQFWTIRDYVEEGFAWMKQLLARADEGISLVIRAKALAYAGTLSGFRGNTEAIIKYGNEAATLAEVASEEDKSALTWALGAQAYGARAAGDHQTAYTLAKRKIQLDRELGDSYQLGLNLSIWSFVAMSLGKYDEARAMLNEGLPLIREVGNPYRIAMALNFSGDLARCERNYHQAKAAYEESISLLREIDAVRDLASALHNLGHTYLHLGDVDRAKALFIESMASHQEQGNRPGMTECLLGFAGLAVITDLPSAGARLLAAAEAIGGQHITSEWAATRLDYEGYLALARESLTENEFQAEQSAGRALSLEQAVAYAQDVASKADAKQKARRKLDELTPREREVAALIARARSNEEIAGELVVSKRTVEKHISNIRSKLGFTRRAQIVRWAIECGLVDQSGETSPQ